MPCMMACSGAEGVDNTLCRWRLPESSNSKKSVNVPPVSMPMNAIGELYKIKNLNHRGHRGAQRISW